MYNDLRGSCFFRRRKDVSSWKCSVILNRANSSLPYASNVPYVVLQIFVNCGKFSGIKKRKKKERNKSAVILCNNDFVRIFFFFLIFMQHLLERHRDSLKWNDTCYNAFLFFISVTLNINICVRYKIWYIIMEKS